MTSNFFGSKFNTILLLVLIVLMVFALRIMLKDKETYLSWLIKPAEVNDKWENISNGSLFQADSSVLGKKSDLVYFTIIPNAKMSGIKSYRGSIKGAWFFEGNIQINILDKNKQVIKSSNAVAKTDWMTVEPVEFEGNTDFTNLPKGPAYFEIHNDNASGLPENDKSIFIPILIQ